MQGSKRIILIPPTQTYLISNNKDEQPLNYSPINFFEPNYDLYPNFLKIRGKMFVEIKNGDCLYIPLGWWHHVKSSEGGHFAVNFWYTANFMEKNLMKSVNEINNKKIK